MKKLSRQQCDAVQGPNDEQPESDGVVQPMQSLCKKHRQILHRVSATFSRLSVPTPTPYRVVVLDLDNTLVHSVDAAGTASVLQRIASDGIGASVVCPVATVCRKLLVFLRPYLIHFLLQIRAHCDKLLIWSAGEETYVLDVVHRVIQPFLPLHGRPNNQFFDAIFARPSCLQSVVSYGSMKDLRLVRDHLSACGNDFSRRPLKIAMLDDIPSYGEQSIGVIVPVTPFYASIHSLASDDALESAGNAIFETFNENHSGGAQ